MSDDIPRSGREERKDRATRLLIENVEALKKQMSDMERYLESSFEHMVSYRVLAGSIVAILTLIGVLVGVLMTPVKEATITTKQEMREARKEISEATKKLDADMKQLRIETTAETKAIYQVVIEGRSKGAAKAEKRMRVEEAK